MQINAPVLEKTILAFMNILDKHALQSLETWLVERERQLLIEIDSGQKAEEAETSPDQGSEVNDQQERAGLRERTSIQDAQVQRDSNELADVRSALARLNDGSYGTCIDCGQSIGLQRLVAMPSAARCMACQMKSETRDGIRT